VRTIQEIKQAILRLTNAEAEALRDWIDDHLEAHFELDDEVGAKIEQSRNEIAGGQFTIRAADAATNLPAAGANSRRKVQIRRNVR